MASKYSQLSEEEKQKRREAGKRYYAEHREACKEERRKRYAEIGHLWPSSSPEKRQIASRRDLQKRKTDPTRKAQYLKAKREWEARRRKERHDLVREEWNAWRRNNKDKYNEQRRLYWGAPARREKHNANKRDYRSAQKEKVFNAYGGCCDCCGEDNFAFLTIDHINNDGNIRRKAKEHPAGGHALYRFIEKAGFPKEFQLLCWNCNVAKMIYGECPHKAAACVLVSSKLTRIAV